MSFSPALDLVNYKRLVINDWIIILEDEQGEKRVDETLEEGRIKSTTTPPASACACTRTHTHVWRGVRCA